MPRPSFGCACGYSLAVICGVASAGAMAAVLAQRSCAELGGRVSESAWVCEAAGSAVAFWPLLGLQGAVLSALAAGLPVYLIVRAVARRYGW